MAKKIKFTAFATDSKTGKRGHGSGETTVGNEISPSRYEDAATWKLQRQGYKDIAGVHITSFED